MFIVLSYFIALYETKVSRPRYLPTVDLIGDQGVQVITAQIGQVQDFICPTSHEFSLYLVSYNDFIHCRFRARERIHDCNTPWQENKVGLSFGVPNELYYLILFMSIWFM